MLAWRRAEHVLGSIVDSFDRLEPQPVPRSPKAEANGGPPTPLGDRCIDCGRRHNSRTGRGYITIGPDGLCVRCRTDRQSEGPVSA